MVAQNTKTFLLKVNRTATATKQQMAELRELRDELVANFREQMMLRHRLMEIGQQNCSIHISPYQFVFHKFLTL
jgi:hypothetical protein